MGRIATGWHLAKASFRVLKLDPEVLAIPAMAFVTMVLLVGAEALAGWSMGAFATTATGGQNPITYVFVYLIYATTAFVGIFFNVAIIEEASIRFSGQNPTIKDGLRKAWSKKGKILKWALITATVGLLLRVLRERAGSLMGSLAVGLLEMGWAIATFFVVPILIYKDVGPMDAIKQSSSIVKSKWGEAFVGVTATGLIFLGLGVLGLIPLFLGVWSGTAVGAMVGIGIAVTYWLLLASANSAVRGILVAALFHYHEKGVMPNGFERATPNALRA